MLSPTPHYYQVRGRAAEIARFEGAGRVAAEHLFLAMLHDGGWPVSVLTSARLFDPEQVESAVVAAMNAPGYTPSPGPPLPGGRTAAGLGDSYIGLEHAFLAIIRDRGRPSIAVPWPALADLDEVEAAVLAAKNAPPRAPDDAVFLPDGQDLDAGLLAALEARVPAGASFGFNRLDGRTWIHVWGDGR